VVGLITLVCVVLLVLLLLLLLLLHPAGFFTMLFLFASLGKIMGKMGTRNQPINQ
jgi:hypothetical protein